MRGELINWVNLNGLSNNNWGLLYFPRTDGHPAFAYWQEYGTVVPDWLSPVLSEASMATPFKDPVKECIEAAPMWVDSYGMHNINQMTKAQLIAVIAVQGAWLKKHEDAIRNAEKD